MGHKVPKTNEYFYVVARTNAPVKSEGVGPISWSENIITYDLKLWSCTLKIITHVLAKTNAPVKSEGQGPIGW
jgi:hypothetical protein